MRARSNPTTVARATRIALVAGAMTLGLGTAAHGQSMRAGGSIGVSLTILQPVATQAVHVVGFDVDRNGLATLRTTVSSSAPVSQIVMTRLAQETSVATTVRPVSSLVPSTGATSAMRYVVDLGRVPSGESRQPVQLRLQYLTVAGT